MSQGKNPSDPPPNCVQVWNIPKTLTSACRHFDTILEAMRSRIGKIKYLQVWEVASENAPETVTCAFMELQDARRNFELIHAIQEQQAAASAKASKNA